MLRYRSILFAVWEVCPGKAFYLILAVGLDAGPSSNTTDAPGKRGSSNPFTNVRVPWRFAHRLATRTDPADTQQQNGLRNLI